MEGRRPPGGTRARAGGHVGAGRAHPAPSAVRPCLCLLFPLGAWHGTDPPAGLTAGPPGWSSPTLWFSAGGPLPTTLGWGTPSVWAWGVCSFDPSWGQPQALGFPGCFLYPVGPHPILLTPSSSCYGCPRAPPRLAVWEPALVPLTPGCFPYPVEPPPPYLGPSNPRWGQPRARCPARVAASPPAQPA